MFFNAAIEWATFRLVIRKVGFVRRSVRGLLFRVELFSSFSRYDQADFEAVP